jgi:membrane protease subunit HflC
MNSIIKTLVLIVIAAGVLLAYSAAYVVDETEQILITQFGRVIGEPVTEPGLNFKLPFFQQTNSFPKNLLQWDGDPGQVPTKDKTYIWVDTFARWKIVDPIKYFQTVTNEIAAIERLDDIIDPAMRNLVTSYPLVESVRNSSRRMDTFESVVNEKTERIQYTINLGRDEITKRIVPRLVRSLHSLVLNLLT